MGFLVAVSGAVLRCSAQASLRWLLFVAEYGLSSCGSRLPAAPAASGIFPFRDEPVSPHHNSFLTIDHQGSLYFGSKPLCLGWAERAGCAGADVPRGE